MLCNSSPQSFWENPAWTHFCCSDRWIFGEAAEKQSNVTAKQWHSFNQRVTRAFILWKLQTGRLTAGNTDKAAREIASVRASELNARLTDTRSATGFHTRIFLVRFRRNVWRRNGWNPYLPWNQSLQISHSIINRLTSYGCRQTQYSWAVAIFGLSPNNAAKLGSSWAGIPLIMRKQHREERSARAGRRGHAVASCINTARDARQVTSSLRNTMSMIEW